MPDWLTNMPSMSSTPQKIETQLNQTTKENAKIATADLTFSNQKDKIRRLPSDPDQKVGTLSGQENISVTEARTPRRG
jgi:hypothetical protein